MNTNFAIYSGEFELLPRIENLWYELKSHHRSIDPEFPDMSTPTFEARKEGLRNKSQAILVECVRNKSMDADVGYCFSIIDKNNIGEIESLYVQEAFRGNGIGKELVNRALTWFDEKKVSIKRLSVRSGNTAAIDFYKHFGFRSRVQELMIPRDKN